jgi:hypothetical protein
MAHRVKLIIENTERELLSCNYDYFRAHPNDPMLLSKEDREFIYLTPQQLHNWQHRLLEGFDRHQLGCGRKPRASVFGGLFRVIMESTDDDDFFYHWFKSTQITHGVLEFYNEMDEDLPFRRLEFWDGWISNISEEMTSTSNMPMLLYLEISADTVRFNKTIVFRQNWFITDIDAKPVPIHERQETQLLVQEVKGEKEAKPGQKITYEVTKYNKDEVSEDDKKRVQWAVKVDGKQENLKEKDAKITLEIKKEWAGKEIVVMACLEKFIEKVSQKTKVKGFYYKGQKQWGSLQAEKPIANLLRQGRQAYISQVGTQGADTIDMLKSRTEEEVKKIYEKGGLIIDGVRDVLRENTANLVINHFYNGNGEKLPPFDENTKISKDLATNPTFKTYFSNYIKVITEILEKRDINTIGEVGITDVFKKNNFPLMPDFSVESEMYIRGIRENQYEYYGLMGGTQTIKVDLEIEGVEIDKYKIKTTMYIGDWYGADWDDIEQGKSVEEIVVDMEKNYTKLGSILVNIPEMASNQFQSQKLVYNKGYVPSLNAFFMLQHWFGAKPENANKYMPFETEIIYKSEDMIKIERK